MSGDLAAEYELEYISLLLPLPYRVALALILGIWAWGAILQYCYLINIDVSSLINPQRENSHASSSAHTSVYRLAVTLTAPLALCLFLFWSLSQHRSSLIFLHDFLPTVYLFILFISLLLPIRPFHSPGRSRFLVTLRRILIGGLAKTKDGKFGDIILADVLTSYAKIIADLFVVFCMFFSKESVSATVQPNRSCGGRYLVPIITAIPYLIRLRQCLTEFWRVKYQTSGFDSGGRHLANALKYTTALPVIAFSALHSSISESVNKQNVGLSQQSVYYCWLTAIFINSSYSFYWDVAKDWDLEFFPAIFEWFHSSGHPGQSNQSHDSSLRKNSRFYIRPCLFLTCPEPYYLAIFLDFILRFFWLIKLTSRFADSESGIVLLEFVEVGRRFIWIVLRLETEWARQSEARKDSVLNDVLSERNNDFDGND